MEQRDGEMEREEGPKPKPLKEQLKNRWEQNGRITEHVIGHVVGGAILGVMAWVWTHSPTGFVMTVFWGAGVYMWNKIPQVQAMTERRRFRLGIALTLLFWLTALLII